MSHIDKYIDGNVRKAVKEKQLSPSMLKVQLEMELYALTMEAFNFNQTRAAIALGVNRLTLRSKLVKLFGDKYIQKRNK